MGLLRDDKFTPEERIELINYVRGKLPIDYSTEMTIIPLKFNEYSCRIPVIISEREELQAFFGEYYSNRGTCTILYKTTAEWDSMPDLVSKTQTIYVYIDGSSYVNDQGETVYVPTVKIGNGQDLLIEMPFLGDAARDLLIKHIRDTYAHFAPGEREIWREEIESKVSQEDVNESVVIFTDTGIFTQEELEELMNNSLKTIQYGNQLYKLIMKNGNIYKYVTLKPNVNELSYVSVNINNGRWTYETYTNTVLDDHINDQVRHITAEERSFWNNKLNTEGVDLESLILNRN